MTKAKAEKIYRCKHTDVVVLNRQRKKMNEDQFEELCGSIEKHGQLQPGVCRLDEDDSPVLIIGERRLKACEKLGIKFSYTLKEDIEDEATLQELELTENLYRENLSWQDRVEAILCLHELWQETRGTTRSGTSGGHGIRDTAAELHTSVGNTQEDIELALFAREIPEVAEAPNKTVAKNIVRRIKSDVHREAALDEALEKANESRESLREGVTKIGTKGVSPAEIRAAATSAGTPIDEGIEEGSDLQVAFKQEARILDYDRRSLEGKLEDLASSLQQESFDVVIFDPPWGVEHDKVSIKSGKAKNFDDSKEKFDKNIQPWLEIIFKLMKPDSHLYLFFGIVNHQKVYDALEAVGFTTNRMPILWKKRGAHHTRNPKVWPGRCYEAIAYARKGSKDLVTFGVPDIIETPAPTQRMKDSHPNAKHPDIYRNLLLRSCNPGELVLDPMSGSGMFGVACESLRTELALDWYQIEEDEDFRTLGIYNLTRGYGEITGYGELELITAKPYEAPEIPEDFKEIKVGSEDWKRYWKAHPEKQGEMLEWRKKKG
ncbi:MAG: ParB N-terminal domain-containing protein [Candidatus Bathyarchaeota archaeon]|nr:ParB N-terminal domain-containing protein [Candidatus Bathyarchaeota archaeon]